MKNQLIPIERVEKLILLLRGEKVLLGQQLAELYGVPTKVLIQAVKRNRNRFPEDFMFQLSGQEFDNLKSQIVTSSWGGLRRALPHAFTEQGVAMLSSVLRSERAVRVNIAIMRAFVGLRRLLATNEVLARKLTWGSARGASPQAFTGRAFSPIRWPAILKRQSDRMNRMNRIMERPKARFLSFILPLR